MFSSSFIFFSPKLKPFAKSLCWSFANSLYLGTTLGNLRHSTWRQPALRQHVTLITIKNGHCTFEIPEISDVGTVHFKTQTSKFELVLSFEKAQVVHAPNTLWNVRVCSHQWENKGSHLCVLTTAVRAMPSPTRAATRKDPAAQRTVLLQNKEIPLALEAQRCEMRCSPPSPWDHLPLPPGHSLCLLPSFRAAHSSPRWKKGTRRYSFFPALPFPHFLLTGSCPPRPFPGYNLQFLGQHSPKSDNQRFP